MDKIELKTECWDEGAPIGNGKIGSIVYGSNPIKITVDRTDLWDLRPNEVTLEKDLTTRISFVFRRAGYRKTGKNAKGCSKIFLWANRTPRR